ncbi:MAG: hypothetical protein QOE22_169 [Candidatus Parcubacteria bacterium]|jgi:hypothetical protein|nr:hypothetical protein [Candidatus Parcubacteria bacterium]
MSYVNSNRNINLKPGVILGIVLAIGTIAGAIYYFS